MNIKSIIIHHSVDSNGELQERLDAYFPEIDVVECCTIDDGVLDIIQRCKPELIFLGVISADSSAFDFINQVEDKKFDLIVVAEDNSHAKKAIDYNSLAYIVKPIQPEELAKGIDKAIRKKLLSEERIIVSANALDAKVESHDNKIGLPTADGLDFVKVEDIIRCEGSNKYTNVHIINSKPLLCSYNVGMFKKMLEPYDFYLSHKSHLINMHHIDKYYKEGTIKMIDGAMVPVSVRKRTEFMDRVERL